MIIQYIVMEVDRVLNDDAHLFIEVVLNNKMSQTIRSSWFNSSKRILDEKSNVEEPLLLIYLVWCLKIYLLHSNDSNYDRIFFFYTKLYHLIKKHLLVDGSQLLKSRLVRLNLLDCYMNLILDLYDN